MDINKFVSPIEEQVVDDPGDLLDHVTEIFTQSTEEDTSALEQQEVKDISLVDALNRISQVIGFKERQENIDLAELDGLRRIQRCLTTQLLQANGIQVQRKLDSYFGHTTTLKGGQNQAVCTIVIASIFVVNDNDYLIQ